MSFSSVQALTLSPGTLAIETDPDKPQAFIIKIFNEGQEKITVTPSVQSFTVESDTGRKILLPPGSVPNSIAQYIEFNALPFELEARQAKSFPFYIKVPANILGGNHALVLFHAVPFRSPLSVSQARIAIGVRLGTTILQESKGSLVIKSRIKKVEAKPESNEIELHIVNEGNTFIDAAATIAIMDAQETNFFGTVRIPKKYVLRGKNAILKAKIPNKLKPGKYKLLVTYTYRKKSISIFSSFEQP